jgi:hypothetical protein
LTKKIAMLFVLALGSAMMLNAQEMKDKGKMMEKGTEMTGVICSSKCVNTTPAPASCKADCKDKSGDAVFIDDQGKVTKIANSKKVKGHFGKKVKMHGEMMKGKDMMEVYDVTNLGAGL